MGNLERAKNITTMEKLVQGTAINSTSGTSIDFTGIPNWVKRITVMFNGLSTNGTSLFLLQIGSGSIVTSGYVSGVQVGTVYNSSTSGLILINSLTAADNISGVCIINLLDSLVWTSISNMNRPGAALMPGAGNAHLAGTLDRIRITTANGTDAFDAGQINIMYEG